MLDKSSSPKERQALLVDLCEKSSPRKKSKTKRDQQELFCNAIEASSDQPSRRIPQRNATPGPSTQPIVRHHWTPTSAGTVSSRKRRHGLDGDQISLPALSVTQLKLSKSSCPSKKDSPNGKAKPYALRKKPKPSLKKRQSLGTPIEVIELSSSSDEEKRVAQHSTRNIIPIQGFDTLDCEVINLCSDEDKASLETLPSVCKRAQRNDPLVTELDVQPINLQPKLTFSPALEPLRYTVELGTNENTSEGVNDHLTDVNTSSKSCLVPTSNPKLTNELPTSMTTINSMLGSAIQPVNLMDTQLIREPPSTHPQSNLTNNPNPLNTPRKLSPLQTSIEALTRCLEGPINIINTPTALSHGIDQPFPILNITYSDPPAFIPPLLTPRLFAQSFLVPEHKHDVGALSNVIDASQLKLTSSKGGCNNVSTLDNSTSLTLPTTQDVDSLFIRPSSPEDSSLDSNPSNTIFTISSPPSDEKEDDAFLLTHTLLYPDFDMD